MGVLCELCTQKRSDSPQHAQMALTSPLACFRWRFTGCDHTTSGESLYMCLYMQEGCCRMTANTRVSSGGQVPALCYHNNTALSQESHATPCSRANALPSPPTSLANPPLPPAVLALPRCGPGGKAVHVALLRAEGEWLRGLGVGGSLLWVSVSIWFECSTRWVREQGARQKLATAPGFMIARIAADGTGLRRDEIKG